MYMFFKETLFYHFCAELEAM